jgi:hypothetical protein
MQSAAGPPALASPNLPAASAVAEPSRIGCAGKSVHALLQAPMTEVSPPVPVLIDEPPVPMIETLPALPVAPPLPRVVEDGAGLAEHAKEARETKGSSVTIRRIMVFTGFEDTEASHSGNRSRLSDHRTKQQEFRSISDRAERVQDNNQPFN